jgi:hypothetical protein
MTHAGPACVVARSIMPGTSGAIASTGFPVGLSVGSVAHLNRGEGAWLSPNDDQPVDPVSSHDHADASEHADE